MAKYSSGVSGEIIWTNHILFGLYFIYLGYKLFLNEQYKKHGLVLMSVGSLMFLYHSYLFLKNKKLI